MALPALLLALTVYLGYAVDRADTAALLAAYFAFFTLYLAIVREPGRDWRRWIALGIVLRAALLFSVPNLSDDLYRFLWDGRLLVHGIHPFAHPPAYFIENQLAVPGLTPELYERLNSPQYYTVYPPVCQAVFALAAWLSPQSWWGGTLVIKLCLFAGELGTLALLRRPWPSAGPGGAAGERRAAWYALNPLAVIEVVGNCHFEGALIVFLLAGLWALQAGQPVRAGIGWALATAAKLLPLLLVPLAWRWLSGRRGWRFLAAFAAALLVLFMPLFDPVILHHMASSLGLYFRQFAFNASVFYVLRFSAAGLGWWNFAMNLGSLLGAVTVAGVLLLTARLRRRPDFARLGEFLLAALCLHLLNASTVHPWYVLVPFAVSLLTRWRFPTIWTGLVALSYSHYAGGGANGAERYALIFLEYGVVAAFFAWEVFAARRVSSGGDGKGGAAA
jgi:alpha-1,6-mannosyltransferase